MALALPMVQSSRRFDTVLGDASIAFAQAVSDLDDYIGANLPHGNPDPRNGNDWRKGMEARKVFLSSTEEGLAQWEKYTEAHKAAMTQLQDKVVELMDLHFAVSATHIGVAPDEWPKTAGGRQDYRTDPSNMMSKKDILDAAELKQFKFDREMALAQRRVYMTNHAFNHCCSTYCWRPTVVDRQFLPEKDVVGKEGVREIYESQNGQRVKIEVLECRMGFGYQRFARQGCDNDRTGGAPPVPQAQIKFDANGQLKFVSARNHPTVVAEPIALSHWGANSDLQVFLLGAKSRTVATEAMLEYGKFTEQLHLAGVGGLEFFSALNTSLEYTCGYSCKGAQNSAEWTKTFKAVAHNVAELRADATLSTVVYKFMHKVNKARDVPLDEAMFLLAGGKYVFNTMKVKKFSLSSVAVADLAEIDLGNTSSGSGGFFGQLRRYGERPPENASENLYNFTARKGSFAPYFFGYDNKVTWPLSETFPKAMLVLFKPHWGQLDGL